MSALAAVKVVIALILIVVALIILIAISRKQPPPLNGGCLVVRNVNDEVGFFFMMVNVLWAAHWAQHFGLHLVILLDSGLYLETDKKFLRQYGQLVEGGNWWNYYFEPTCPADIYAWATQQGGGKSFDHRLVREGVPELWKWDRAASDLPNQRVYGDLALQCARVFRPLPHVVNAAREFYTVHLKDKFVIGLAYRGTDKLGNKESDEDGPKKYEYEFIRTTLARAVQQKAATSVTPIIIFVATDEQPLLDYLILESLVIGCPIVFTDSHRSSANTGGVHLNSSLCLPTPQPREHVDCEKYRALRETSVHRGHRHLSSYEKGLQVLIDVLLLSRCDVFYKSAGNVSGFVRHLNPRQTQYALNEVYMGACAPHRPLPVV